jgi:hypothetical protein
MVNKLLSEILTVSLLLEIVVTERRWYTKYHLRMGEEHGRSVGTKGELVWIVSVKRVMIAGGSGPFRNGFAKIIMSWRHYT